MLTTPRAIVVAAVLIAASVLAHAMLPRYDISKFPGDTVAVQRVDRWTGTMELGAFGKNAPWWLAARGADAAPPLRPFPDTMGLLLGGAALLSWLAFIAWRLLRNWQAEQHWKTERRQPARL